MGRRNLHTREQQIEMAIAAAELILVSEGMPGLTMRKVADAIGYTVGNLYLLFENQDQLLVAVNERTADAVYVALRDALEAAAEPRVQVREIAAAYIEYAMRHASRWRLMFEHSLPVGSPRPRAVELRINRMFELVQSALAPHLPGAPEPSLRLNATTLWSGVHGICVLAVTGKLRWSGTDRYRALSDHLVDTFLRGLAKARVVPS
jgi:AcrR family transcriptional regulator